MTQWRIVRLREVCHQDRVSVRAGDRPDLRYIGLETIESNTGCFIEGELSKTPETPQANSFQFSPRHVLYGKLRPYLNKVAVSDFEGKCSTELVPLLPSEVVDRRYLAYFLRSPHVVARISAKTAGARMPRADMDFVMGLEFPLRPLQEQHRIVDLLSRADGIVRLRRQAQKKAAEIIPALFLDMFGDPATNPKGWPKCRLEELCKISYGLADKLDTSITVESGSRILTISNVLLEGNIDDSVERFCVVNDNQREKASVKRGDLLFNWRNGSEQHIGKTAMWESDDVVLHVSFLLRLRPQHDHVTSLFLWALLNRLRASGYFINASRQQINRKFNASELSALEISVPPYALQKRFTSTAETARAIGRQQASAVEVAVKAFNSLLAEMFSGEKAHSLKESDK